MGVTGMLKKQDSKSKRRFFGEAGKAWWVVEISEDDTQAFLREFCFGGDTSVQREDLIKALEDEYGIRAGIKAELLDRVMERGLGEPEGTYRSGGDVVIAEGRPPLPPTEGSVDYKFLDLVGKKVDLPYAELLEAFQKPLLEEVLERDLRVRATAPGATIAVLTPPTAGSPGRDMFGNPTSMARRADAGTAAFLSVGENVLKDDDRYISEIYGYVCIQGSEISVRPPVWVSPDCSDAFFIHFPHVGPQVFPEPEWLVDILALMEIFEEIPGRAIQGLTRFLVDDTAKKGRHRLLQGKPPVPGQDAHLDCRFGPDISRVVAVREGQLLAAVVEPTVGEPGMNIRGEEVPASDGTPREFKAGENVRVVLEGGRPRFFHATINGNVHVDGTRIEVNPVLRIEGDVDEKTGNIESGQDIVITGSVRKGLKVSAEGSVVISGVVEQGASVNAKGDVIVEQGIMGADTKVLSLGSVETKFIQESSVMTRRNTIVLDHLFKANIRAGGELVVRPGDGPRSGSIVGGEVYATTRLEAEVVGASSGIETIVGVLPEVEAKAKLRKLSKQIEFFDSNSVRILRTLGIESLDAGVVQAYLKQVPEFRRKSVVALIMKLKQLLEAKGESQKTEKELHARIRQGLQDAEVQINQEAYTAVSVKVGDAGYTVTKDMERPTFSLSSGVVKWEQKSPPEDGDPEADAAEQEVPEEA